MGINRFQERIAYQGNLKPLMEEVASVLNLGQYQHHGVIQIGYEDLNIKLITNQGKYFVKVFGKLRMIAEIHRYIQTIQTVITAGISHPTLYEINKSSLYTSLLGNTKTHLIVMEYIEGKSFYELKERPSQREQKLIIKQAALINSLPYKPSYHFDNWSVTNFQDEFKKKKKWLTTNDKQKIQAILKEFSKINLEDLPHSFVHGDLISTNIMRSKTNQIYIIDFAVSNWYPRITELAILLCDVLFDENPNQTEWVINEYQKYLKLTPQEISVLPVFVQAAHAMHIIGASFEKTHGNKTRENEYWLKLGRKGIFISEPNW